MSLIKVVLYVIGITPGVPGAPEPRMYPRSGYFLVLNNSKTIVSRKTNNIPLESPSNVPPEMKKSLNFLKNLGF